MLRSITPKRARPRPHRRCRLRWIRVKTLRFSLGNSGQRPGAVSLLVVPHLGSDQLALPSW
jgi:hypothetical protein